MAQYRLDALTMPDGNDYVVDQRGKTFFGYCSTAAATAAKTVSIDGFTSENLVNGTKITVYFNYGNSATGVSLNINSTGSCGLGWQWSQLAFLPKYSCVDLIFDGEDGWSVVGVRQPDWFGVCSTAASTQAKTVSITGFSAANLVNGTRVTVLFTYQQGYNGAPTLNVSLTGAKTIQSIAGTNAGQYEWRANQIVSFVYYNGYWVIEDGAHATTTFWGKTKLSSTIADDETMALTPKAVYDAGFATTSQLPTKVSDLTNDSGFINTETDPTVPSWAKQSSKPTYTASEVGALPDTTSIPSTAADVGAIAAPSNPATGSFLVWSGTAWTAQTLSTWQGGNY